MTIFLDVIGRFDYNLPYVHIKTSIFYEVDGASGTYGQDTYDSSLIDVKGHRVFSRDIKGTTKVTVFDQYERANRDSCAVHVQKGTSFTKFDVMLSLLFGILTWNPGSTAQ